MAATTPSMPPLFSVSDRLLTMPVPQIEASRPVLLRGGRNKALKPVTITCRESFRQSPAPARRSPVKLTNLTIAPKLGILVGLAVFGLCLIGAVVVYLTQRDIPNPGMLGLPIAGVA